MYDARCSGTIFHIQKFSINDGPGIRTVIFLKGCPLRCRWCANPESQSTHVQILWDSAKCQHCGHCTQVCPVGAIHLKNGAVKIAREICTACKRCAVECPFLALTTEGEERTVEEVLKVCLQDRDFYEESGGGITLSGGEALMQPDFSVELLKAFHENNIHTAIETTGFAPRTVLKRITEYLDLILFDMKHWDEARHQDGTGVPNSLILENMRWAVSSGKDILVRLPVIPGFNHTIADAEKFVHCLKAMGVQQVQLLPFHNFG